MAEGWTRHLRGDEFEPFSAGTAPSRIDPRAVSVVAEAGVDISGQRSNSMNEYVGRSLDWIVTVCDNAREQCPFFPGKDRRVHVDFEDPPHLAKETRTEEEALSHYRRVRDEIRALVEDMPRSLQYLEQEA